MPGTRGRVALTLCPDLGGPDLVPGSFGRGRSSGGPDMKKPQRRGNAGASPSLLPLGGKPSASVTVSANGGCCLIDCHALQDIAKRGLRPYCPSDGRPHTKVWPSRRFKPPWSRRMAANVVKDATGRYTGTSHFEAGG